FQSEDGIRYRNVTGVQTCALPIYTELVQAIKDIVTESHRRYGYRRVCLALKKRGIIVNHKKVLRLMRQYQLLCVKFKHRNRQYRSEERRVGKESRTKLYIG